MASTIKEAVLLAAQSERERLEAIERALKLWRDKHASFPYATAVCEVSVVAMLDAIARGEGPGGKLGTPGPSGG